MKNVKKKLALCTAIIMLTASLSACGKSNNTPTDTENGGFGEIATVDTDMTTNTQSVIAETTTESTQATTETTEFADPDVPADTDTDINEISNTDMSQFLTKVHDNLDEAKSFRVECKVKGNVPSDDVNSELLKHTYTYDATEKVSYMSCATENLNNDALSTKYEKYQISEDDMVTPYAYVDNTWQKGETTFLSSGNLTNLSLKSIGFIEVLLSDDNISAFTNATYEQTATGYTLSVEWKDFKPNATTSVNMFGGLLRFATGNNPLLKTNIANINGNITYTFDKNFMPTNITCNIRDIADSNYCDVKTELTFSNWNTVKAINVPAEVTKSKPAVVEETEKND